MAFDQIEAEYQIGEMQLWLNTFDERMPDWYAERDKIKKRKKMYEEDLKKIKAELADVQTKISHWEGVKADYEASIRDLRETIEKSLPQTEAVQVLKWARDNGKFNPETNVFSSESKPEADRFKAAIYTMGVSVYVSDPALSDDIWTVRVEDMPESEREFLYGVEDDSSD